MLNTPSRKLKQQERGETFFRRTVLWEGDGFPVIDIMKRAVAQVHFVGSGRGAYEKHEAKDPIFCFRFRAGMRIDSEKFRV